MTTPPLCESSRVCHQSNTPSGSKVPVTGIGTNTTSTGIKAKVENVAQYDEYLDELNSIREDMGVILKEDLYPSSMGGERLQGGKGTSQA